MSTPLDDGRPEPKGGLRLGTVLTASRNNFHLLYQTVAVLIAAAVVLAILGVLLSALRLWVLVLATMALGGVVAVRSYRQRQRAWWIDQGCCAACGYDLHGLPTSTCPECGRDAAQDEPTWRRLRREFDAKHGRPDPALPVADVELDEATIRRLLAKSQVLDSDA